MLNENTNRVLSAKQVTSIIPWEAVEGCIVLTLGAKGKPNHLVMSSLTVEEVALLTAQLQAHLTGLLFNSLIEDVPPGLDAKK